MYDGVNTQIKFTLPNGLYFSLLEPVKMNFIPGYYASEMDAVIPKINVGMHYDLGDINLHPTFGFAMSNYNEDLAGIDEAITAYAFALTGKYDMAPLKFQGQINFGQNIGNYGFKTPMAGYYGMAGWVDDEIVNVTTMGGYLQAAYEMLTVGAGYTMDDSDSLDDPDATMNAFVQYKMKLGNICLMPEAGIIDYMENGYGVTTGAMTYFGMQMRVTIP